MGKGLSPSYTDGQWYYILNFNGLLGVALFGASFFLFFFIFTNMMKLRYVFWPGLAGPSL